MPVPHPVDFTHLGGAVETLVTEDGAHKPSNLESTARSPYNVTGSSGLLETNGARDSSQMPRWLDVTGPVNSSRSFGLVETRAAQGPGRGITVCAWTVL